MKLSLVDTHCDTAFELWRNNASILKNNCHISLEKASVFENYTQFFAVWANKRRSDDEAFEDFLSISDNLSTEIKEHSGKISAVTSFAEMKQAWNDKKTAAFLAEIGL